MSRVCTWCWVVTFALLSATAFAQGNPTGGISGQVVDPDGLALPGVTVTAASPVLQGVRTAVTSANGDYIIPFLPPGIYTVTFELSGFAMAKHTASVEIGETIPVKARLTLAGVTETVTVTGTATEIAQTATVASTFKSETIERLPMGRTVTAYALLAPGVNDNGPNGNMMMSGAMSYENLNLINGVVVNENLRGQSRTLFIEDAIQESKISTGSISAEYGRFQGGVVNTITKSGGNQFSGSVRISFTNDGWKSLTPYPGDQNISDTVPAYEGTFGGPIFRDRLWFFGAGRYEDRKNNITTDFTSYNFIQGNEEKRYEGKLTYSLNAKNTAKFSYIKRRLDSTNAYYTSATAVLDQASLYDNANDESLLSANYTSVLTSNFFVEGQYSARQLSFIGTGSQYTDLVKGTPIWDRSRSSARFNSPTFCAVCGTGLEERDNWNAFAKANYFLSTKSLGSHSVVGGFDVYKEMRKNDNYQSGSSFRIQATSAVIDGTTIYPVFRTGTTYVDFLPLVAQTKGNDIRTYSFFLNDAWRLNNRFSFNAGVRYDRNRSKDQAGTQVVKDSAWSPRLGLTWDIKGNGNWKATAGFARYVMGISTAIVDAGSAGGRTATYSYAYQGPVVNAAPPYVTADQALPILFNWFFPANGSTGVTDGYPNKLPTRNPPSVPGVTTQVGTGLKAPNSDEYSVGLSRQLGQKGAVRVDWLYRKYRDFYGDYRDATTGTVYEPVSKRTFDLLVVKNTNSVERDYKGLNAQLSYRFSPQLNAGANYTLSYARGSIEGETATDGPVRASANDMPEYRAAAWNYPVGYTNGDQRHKARAWASYQLPLPASIGRVDVGVMQRFDSGSGYDWNATIDPRPYVTNPGYITPTSSVTYYFSDRGEFRRDGIWRTDFSLNWETGLPGVARGRLFFRGIVDNLFKNTGIDGFNTTIQTRAQNSALPAFNPFTETPVQGTHYIFGPEYGKVTGPGDYQAPREFSFSVGMRF